MRRVNEYRAANVLPSPALAQDAALPIKAIRIHPQAHGLPWWRAEHHIEIDHASAVGDQRPVLAKTCSQCGACCRDLPKHQIGIYMSTEEVVEARRAGFDIVPAADITVGGVPFVVLGVKPNGDCAMLGDGAWGDEGCRLGDLRPLWCKAFYCEALYGGRYEFIE